MVWISPILITGWILFVLLWIGCYVLARKMIARRDS